MSIFIFTLIFVDHLLLPSLFTVSLFGHRTHAPDADTEPSLSPIFQGTQELLVSESFFSFPPSFPLLFLLFLSSPRPFISRDNANQTHTHTHTSAANARHALTLLRPLAHCSVLIYTAPSTNTRDHKHGKCRLLKLACLFVSTQSMTPFRASPIFLPDTHSVPVSLFLSLVY